MAKQEYEKLRAAIVAIHDECAFHGSCGSCPLAFTEYVCGITGEATSGNGDYRRKPKYWTILSPKLLGEPRYNT